MLVLTQGKTLSPGDLGLNCRDESGQLIDPVSITYSIFSVDQMGIRTLASPPLMIPVRTSLGTFSVAMTIPTTWLGQYNLVWYLVQYPGSPQVPVFEEFQVAIVDPATTSFDAPSVLVTSRPGMNLRIANLVMMTRELLSDENPDRNYHFRPPTPGRIVADFNSRVGYIWTDATIIRMLRLSIQQLNSWNPMALTNWRVEDAPPAWADAAALGAAAHCLSKEASRWTAEGFDYSLNGISLSVNKGAEYQSLAESYKAEFQVWAPLLTANRPCSSGLRQQRWMLGAFLLCAACLPNILTAIG